MPDQPAAAARSGFFEILAIFTRLGFTSFGGPVAHLGYFRDEFVARRKWLDERAYADLVALCQFLPGPASSQVGLSLGLLRGGYAGAAAAWIGFTLPSAVALVAFALGVAAVGEAAGAGWLHGLKIVAVAVVAQAVWGMAGALCPDRLRASLAVGAMALVLLFAEAGFGTHGQLLVIVAGGLIGWRMIAVEGTAGDPLPLTVGRTTAVCALFLFFALLAGLPLAAAALQHEALTLVDRFYRAGSLVFGGGHVVLPLLQAEMVDPGWVSRDAFVAGYGAAQAVPGPLFTFAAFLGAAAEIGPGGWAGGAIALGAIFLPSLLLVVGALPFWDALRRRPAVQGALAGVNAAVVGLLLAALYDPVWTSAILSPVDVALAAAAFLLLVSWKVAPWAVVALCALGGAALGMI